MDREDDAIESDGLVKGEAFAFGGPGSDTTFFSVLLEDVVGRWAFGFRRSPGGLGGRRLPRCLWSQTSGAGRNGRWDHSVFCQELRNEGPDGTKGEGQRHKGEVLVRMEHLGLRDDAEVAATLARGPEFHASSEVLVKAVQDPRVNPLTIAVKPPEGYCHCSAIGKHNDDIHRGFASHQAGRRLLVITLGALSRFVNKRAPQQLKHEVTLDRCCIRDSCFVACLVVQMDPTVVAEVGHQSVRGDIGVSKGESGPLVSLIVREQQFEGGHRVRAMHVDHGFNAIVSHFDANDV